MQRVVTLPIQYARCVPSGYCKLKDTCARYLVPYTQGRPMADYSINRMLNSCGNWLPASQFMGDDKPKPGPKVHEAVKGLA